MVEEYVLMKDENVKNLFTNPITGKEYSASVIANVLGLEEKYVLDNLEYAHPNIRTNSNIVDNEVDTLYEMNKILINIEFNRSGGTRLKNKNEAYICQLYLRQLPDDTKYDEVKPIIQINIDAYDRFRENRFLYHSIMMETISHKVESKNIEIYHINLSYLRKKGYNEIEEKRLEELLYILVCKDIKRLENLYEGDELMSKVVKAVKRDMEALDAWLYYDKEELIRLDMEDAEKELANKKKEIEEAKKELVSRQKEIEKVEKEMISKQKEIEKVEKEMISKQKEIEKVEKEMASRQKELDEKEKVLAKQKSIEIAKSMLKDNIDIATISKYTNLSQTEIETLK